MSSLLTHAAINNLEQAIKQIQKTLEEYKYDDSIKAEIESLLHKINATPAQSQIIQYNDEVKVITPEGFELPEDEKKDENAIYKYFYHIDWAETPGVYKVDVIQGGKYYKNSGVVIISKYVMDDVETTTQYLFLFDEIKSRKGTEKVVDGACPMRHTCPEWEEWSSLKGGADVPVKPEEPEEPTAASNGYIEIEWTKESNLNDYLESGVYFLKNGTRYNNDDNLPISNIDDAISFKLIVTHAYNGSLNSTETFEGNEHSVIGQTLILTNRLGHETKAYTRDYIYEVNHASPEDGGDKFWKPWREFKGILNLGQVSDDKLKSFKENGLYEGVINNGDSNKIMMDILSGLNGGNYDGDYGEIYIFHYGINADGVPSLPTSSYFTMEVLNNYFVKDAVDEILSGNPSTQGYVGVFPQIVIQKATINLLPGVIRQVWRSYNKNLRKWTRWYDEKMNINFSTSGTFQGIGSQPPSSLWRHDDFDA